MKLFRFFKFTLLAVFIVFFVGVGNSFFSGNHGLDDESIIIE